MMMMQPMLSEEEQALEDQVPPVSTYVGRMKYWYRQFRYPLWVVLGNLAGYGLSLFLQRTSMVLYIQSFYGTNNNDETDEKQQDTVDDHQHVPTLVATGSLVVVVVVFLVDCRICLRGAREMEQRVQEQQDEDADDDDDDDDGQGTERPSGTVPSSDTPENPAPGVGSNRDISNDDDDMDMVHMSKAVDRAFSCGSDSASATFFVCLLYAFYSMAVWKAVDSTGALVYTLVVPQTKKFDALQCHAGGSFMRNYGDDSDQYGIPALHQSPSFETLPSDVQDWILQHKDPQSYGGVSNRSLPYLEDSDGSLIFTFSKTVTKHSRFTEDASWPVQKVGLAVHSARNNDSVVEYMNAEPKDDMFSGGEPQISLIGFPEVPPYTGWCAVFEVLFSSMLQDEAICYNSSSSSIGTVCS